MSEPQNDTKKPLVNKSPTIRKGKTVVVVKKRGRPLTRGSRRPVHVPVHGDQLRCRRNVGASHETRMSNTPTNKCKTHTTEDGAESNNDDYGMEDDGIDGNIFCDTLQLIRHMQGSSPPVVNHPSNQHCLPIRLSNLNHYILAVLECQLYGAGLVEKTVSDDLSFLLNNNQLRKISPPKSRVAMGTASRSNEIACPTIFLTTYDYCKGVKDALHRHATDSEILLQLHQQQACVDWFLENLHQWLGERIARTEFEDVWQTRIKSNRAKNLEAARLDRTDQPTCPLALENVLQYLVQIQVLLPCYSEDSYQIWLPSWPLVAQSWEKMCKSIINQLRCSQYKERSLTALLGKSRSSPIPPTLVFKYLTWVGKTTVVEKPAGKFLKLAMP